MSGSERVKTHDNSISCVICKLLQAETTKTNTLNIHYLFINLGSRQTPFSVAIESFPDKEWEKAGDEAPLLLSTDINETSISSLLLLSNGVLFLWSLDTWTSLVAAAVCNSLCLSDLVPTEGVLSALLLEPLCCLRVTLSRCLELVLMGLFIGTKKEAKWVK